MSDTILNHRLISERYFFPRSSRLTEPFWVDCGDARLGCYYYELDPTAKTIVHFHGNGEIVGDYLAGFPKLIGQLGANCFLAELRGYGASSGAPELGRMLEDVATTLDAIGQPQEQLVLFGRSVGSLFAIKALESHPRVAGLILESAIADLQERLLLRVTPEELGTTPQELDNAVQQGLDIERLMQNYPGPKLIMHTEHDGLVDACHAQQLAAWSGDTANLIIFPDGDHNSIMFTNGPRYFGLVRDFLAGL